MPTFAQIKRPTRTPDDRMVPPLTASEASARRTWIRERLAAIGLGPIALAWGTNWTADYIREVLEGGQPGCRAFFDRAQRLLK